MNDKRPYVAWPEPVKWLAMCGCGWESFDLEDDVTEAARRCRTHMETVHANDPS